MRGARSRDGLADDYSHTSSTSARPLLTVILATLGFKLKRRGPAAPGLTTRRLAGPLDQRLMSMAEDDDVRRVARQQFFRRRAAELVAMADVDGKTFDVDREAASQTRIAGRVGVAVRPRCTGAMADNSLEHRWPPTSPACRISSTPCERRQRSPAGRDHGYRRPSRRACSVYPLLRTKHSRLRPPTSTRDLTPANL